MPNSMETPRTTMDAITNYQKLVEKALTAGDDTEHIDRPALKALLKFLADNTTATNEGKRVKRGAERTE